MATMGREIWRRRCSLNVPRPTKYFEQGNATHHYFNDSMVATATLLHLAFKEAIPCWGCSTPKSVFMLLMMVKQGVGPQCVWREVRPHVFWCASMAMGRLSCVTTNEILYILVASLAATSFKRIQTSVPEPLHAFERKPNKTCGPNFFLWAPLRNGPPRHFRWRANCQTGGVHCHDCPRWLWLPSTLLSVDLQKQAWLRTLPLAGCRATCVEVAVEE